MARKSKEQRPAAALKWWHYALALVALAELVFQVYGPALNGPFVFDDLYLPMAAPRPPDGLAAWMSGVRPILMLTYWFNYRTSGVETQAYHILNVLLHLANATLIFFVVHKLLKLAQKESLLLSLMAGAVFLLHPVQTESVAYIAGRSDALSTLFLLSAFALFLYRRAEAVSWEVTVGVLAIFALAVGTKENTVVLPAVLLLTDYFWNPGFNLDGVKRNWKLYIPVAAGAMAGAVFVLQRIGKPGSAGFSIKEFTPLDYFFTQCRVIFTYLRLFLFPAGQIVDYDYPISRSIVDHGALVGLLALAAITGAAIHYRRRFPLAAYGWLLFLVLLSPTSSIVPILDPIAERRLYLPMLGLLLIAAEFLSRAPIRRTALALTIAGVCFVAGAATYRRNTVWSGAIPLWQDAVAKSPSKARAHFQLASAYYEAHRCEESLAQFETVAKLEKPDYRLLLDWALAYDCLNRPQEAMAKLEQAAAIEKTAHIYSLIGMMYGKQGKRDESLRALETAIRIDPAWDMSYVYRGNVYQISDDWEGAVREYRKAIEVNPANQVARDALNRALEQLRTRPQPK